MADLSKKLQRFLPLSFAQIAPKRDVDIGGLATFPDGFHGTNPSMVAVENGYLVSVRGVNYRLQSSKVSDSIFTVGDRFMSVNRFMLLDRNYVFKCNLPELDSIFDDVEDIKLFRYSGKVMGFGSCRVPEMTGKYDRSACILSIGNNFDNGSIQPLASPYGFKQEKNWAPFVYADALHFIYSFDPLVILRYDDAARTVGFAAWNSDSPAQDQLKFLVGGSSAGLPVGNGYVFAAHRRRVSLPSLNHNYLTCLYYFEPETRALHRGPFFSIGAASVQFVNGLVINGATVWVSYGNRDVSAHICELPSTIIPAVIRNDFGRTLTRR